MADDKQVVEEQKPKYSLEDLSKKNSEYFFQLKKILTTENHYSQEDADQYVMTILDEVVLAQHKGIPANRLYGSPSKKVSDYLKGESEKPTTSYWLLWLDNAIIFGLLLSAMSCLVAFTSKDKSSQAANGLLTIILMSVEFGLPWAYFNLWTIQPKNQRAPIWKLIMIILLGFIGLFIVIGVTVIIPPVLNPPLNGFGYLILSIALFGLHYYLKRKFNIVGTIF